MADRHVLYKTAAKEIAAAQGQSLTFMAKWNAAHAGSSCHVHMSLWNEHDQPVFSAAGDPSPTFRHFLGGLLAHARELGLVPRADRQLLQALPRGNLRADAHHLEHRQPHRGLPRRRTRSRRCASSAAIPGADANPYLVYAALLAAGLDGIERKLDPGRAVRGRRVLAPASCRACRRRWPTRSRELDASAFARRRSATRSSITCSTSRARSSPATRRPSPTSSARATSNASERRAMRRPLIGITTYHRDGDDRPRYSVPAVVRRRGARRRRAAGAAAARRRGSGGAARRASTASCSAAAATSTRRSSAARPDTTRSTRPAPSATPSSSRWCEHCLARAHADARDLPRPAGAERRARRRPARASARRGRRDGPASRLARAPHASPRAHRAGFATRGAARRGRRSRSRRGTTRRSTGSARGCAPSPGRTTAPSRRSRSRTCPRSAGRSSGIPELQVDEPDGRQRRLFEALVAPRPRALSAPRVLGPIPTSR